jgi:hypothetical protein
MKYHAIPSGLTAAGTVVIDRECCKLKPLIMFMDLTPTWPNAAAAS